MALLAGIGTARLLNLAQQQIGTKAAVGLGLGLLVAFSLRITVIAPSLDISADDSAISFGKRALTNLPSEALLISEHDETTFSLWYRQALGERPDVVVIDRRLLAYDWYQRQLLHHHPNLDLKAITLGGFMAQSRPVYVLEGLPGQEEIHPVAVIYQQD
jgi:hypothetical protein